MKKRMIILIMLLVLGATAAFAQSQHDYQTRNNGAWDSEDVWQTFRGGWKDDKKPPHEFSNRGIITIRNHMITVPIDITIDQTIINSDGTLSINNGNTITINNGIGDDLTINGILTGEGSLVNNSNADIVLTNNGHYALSGTLTNNGTITINSNQLSGIVNNHGTIKSDTADIMRSGELTHETGSTVEFTSVVTIPPDQGYKNLVLSAPGVYYLEGDLTGIETLILGENTYLHTNGHTLGYDVVADGDIPRIISDPVLTLSTNNPAVSEGTVAQSGKKHPIYRFTINRDASPDDAILESLSFEVS